MNKGLFGSAERVLLDRAGRYAGSGVTTTAKHQSLERPTRLDADIFIKGSHGEDLYQIKSSSTPPEGNIAKLRHTDIKLRNVGIDLITYTNIRKIPEGGVYSERSSVKDTDVISIYINPTSIDPNFSTPAPTRFPSNSLQSYFIEDLEKNTDYFPISRVGAPDAYESELDVKLELSRDLDRIFISIIGLVAVNMDSAAGESSLLICNSQELSHAVELAVVNNIPLKPSKSSRFMKELAFSFWNYMRDKQRLDFVWGCIEYDDASVVLRNLGEQAKAFSFE